MYLSLKAPGMPTKRDVSKDCAKSCREDVMDIKHKSLRTATPAVPETLPPPAWKYVQGFHFCADTGQSGR